MTCPFANDPMMRRLYYSAESYVLLCIHILSTTYLNCAVFCLTTLYICMKLSVLTSLIKDTYSHSSRLFPLAYVFFLPMAVFFTVMEIHSISAKPLPAEPLEKCVLQLLLLYFLQIEIALIAVSRSTLVV